MPDHHQAVGNADGPRSDKVMNQPEDESIKKLRWGKIPDEIMLVITSNEGLIVQMQAKVVAQSGIDKQGNVSIMLDSQRVKRIFYILTGAVLR